MKTFRMIGMALIAIIMGTTITSCTDDNVSKEPNKITIALSCIGEIIDISHEPLMRSNNANNIYSFTIYTEDDGYIYATGTFNNIGDLKVDLLDGETYCIEVSYTLNSPTVASNQFDYSVRQAGNHNDLLREKCYSSQDVYYGTISGYMPQVNGNIEIYMKRMSFALKLIAKNLSDGASINASLKNAVHSTPSRTTLTYSNSESDKIYSFDMSIWNNVYKGVLSGTEYINYSETAKLQIILSRVDGKEVNLGEYDILLERNYKTIVNIDVDDISSTMANGIVITQEKDEISDGKQYEIAGSEGSIIEIPITGE